MYATATVSFDQVDLGMQLDDMSDDALDALDFGVIAIDAATIVTSYNAFESRLAGLVPERVLGLPLFAVVAPCMNNFMVAHRFEEALAQSATLDVTVPYVLTLKMKPLKVKLRLIAMPGGRRRYVVVQRNA